MRKLIHMLPKPVLFGLLGAVGCMVGWAVGEPVLGLIDRPAPSAENEDGEFQENVSAVLVFNNELQKRLKREGAQTGDVRISLMWDNINDLDLHCIDPNGERIFYEHMKSRSKGELDVDMNAQSPLSNTPVENIYWPTNEAPEGVFKVQVYHYRVHHPRINETPYTVEVLYGDQKKEFKGTVSHEQMKDVFSFSMAPESERRRTLVEIKSQRVQINLKDTVILAIWTALLAICSSAMLVMGQNYLMRRSVMIAKQAAMVGVGGLVAGLVSGGVSQYLFSFITAAMGDTLVEHRWLLKMGQVIGWGLLGALLGLGMGFFIPNLARGKAGLAGLIGGVIGAIAFLVAIAAAGELPGRFMGTAVLGFTIGLVVALVERLAREAALIVHWDPNEQTVINLGAEPVVLGSGNDVHLYLPRERGFPDITALVTFKDGSVQMDNKLTGKVHTLHGGNRLEIGSIIIEIQTDVQPPA